MLANNLKPETRDILLGRASYKAHPLSHDCIIALYKQITNEYPALHVQVVLKAMSVELDYRLTPSGIRNILSKEGVL